MNNKNFEIYFDCGFSMIRAGAFNKENQDETFYTESEFFFDKANIDEEIKKIIIFLEKKTNEYVNDVNLMLDSSEMLSVNLSISKKLDGSKLRQEDVQFLIQEAKQEILKNYSEHNIIHIIMNNYKINNIEYSYLPSEIECNFISLDIFFICLPNKIVEYFKSLFYRFDISINQIVCSSYAKTINYKDNFSLDEKIIFIDIGFNRTSLISYVNHRIVSLNALPIGGNYITKDISKLLKIDLEIAENLKLNFDKRENFLEKNNLSQEMLQKIILARIEEILELCVKSIKLKFISSDSYKIVLMGNGLKISDIENKNNFFSANNVHYLHETPQDICLAGFKLGMGLNNQEVITIPNKLIKQGFFEKLFHFFK